MQFIGCGDPANASDSLGGGRPVRPSGPAVCGLPG